MHLICYFLYNLSVQRCEIARTKSSGEIIIITKSPGTDEKNPTNDFFFNLNLTVWVHCNIRRKARTKVNSAKTIHLCIPKVLLSNWITYTSDTGCE